MTAPEPNELLPRRSDASAVGSDVTDVREIIAELSAVPGIDALADAAFGRMRQAFETRTHSYPFANEQQAPTPAEQNDKVDLQALVADGARSALDVRRIGALALLGARRHWPGPGTEPSSFVQMLFWVECESELPILTLLVRALDSSLQAALGDPLRQLALSGSTILNRGQQSLALIWAQALSGDVSCLRPLLEPRTVLTRLNASAASASVIRGRILSAPRGAILTALAAFSGWMLIRQLFSSVARYTLAYRAQAELNVSERGIEVREHCSMLGHKLRDRTYLIALHAVRSLSREVRYARAGMYAGLLALALGSFLGMRLFVDGLRAPGVSGPTLFMGLIVVLVGLALDFALANWLDSSRVRCRVRIQTVQGRGLYLTCDEPAQVEGVLRELARKLTA